jgi:hypothetical protein
MTIEADDDRRYWEAGMTAIRRLHRAAHHHHLPPRQQDRAGAGISGIG